MSSSNTAAWLTAAKVHPFEVKEAPLWKASENEILVKNHAVAINPVDGSLQSKAWWPMSYPAILGQDVAGVVHSVGPNVSRFKPGDRVVGHAVGMATKRNQDNAFQAYTILQSHMASQLPDHITFENAAKPTGSTLLVWGGASSVGSNAIQLAAAAGYGVVTTASAKNFEYVKKLGATEAFDYHSPNIVDELVHALKGKTIAGAMDCVGFSATTLTADVISKLEGRKFIASVKGFSGELPKDVTVKSVFATTLKDNHVGKAIYVDFLPNALAAGTFVPAPNPMVAGKGLENVQEAVDLQAKGVSARKVVVVL
ncbi:hypothetical protein MAP00_005421 [Monascus purpureus]|nr:hypothetical protein MAP00_005421 [Monascus purpureus]